MSVPDKITAWRMKAPWSKDRETGNVTKGVLELTEIPVPEIKAGESLVEVAGCGVCHTDLGYFYDGVPTVSKPPPDPGARDLGHSGRGGPARKDGPGAGGHALQSLRHLQAGEKQPVPGPENARQQPRGLRRFRKPYTCAVGGPLRHRGHQGAASVSLFRCGGRGYDAVSGRNAGRPHGRRPGGGDRLRRGGSDCICSRRQRHLGAGYVIGIDIDDEKLERALQYGADAVINSKGKNVKEVQEEFKGIAKGQSLPHNWGWKIFEVSGSKPGQEIGTFNCCLSWASSSSSASPWPRSNTGISRLMAFDAEMIGTWGCLPKYYPEVLDLVVSGKIQIEPFLETPAHERYRPGL